MFIFANSKWLLGILAILWLAGEMEPTRALSQVDTVRDKKVDGASGVSKQAHLVAYTPLVDGQGDVVFNLITIRLPVPVGLAWNVKGPRHIQSSPGPGVWWQNAPAIALLAGTRYQSTGRRGLILDKNLQQKEPWELINPIVFTPFTHFDASFCLPANVPIVGKEVHYFQGIEDTDNAKSVSFPLVITNEQLREVESTLQASCQLYPQPGATNGVCGIVLEVDRDIEISRVKVGPFTANVSRNPLTTLGRIRDMCEDVPRRVLFRGQIDANANTKVLRSFSIQLKGGDTWIPFNYRLPFVNQVKQN